MAGILLFGLIARKSSFICSPLLMSTGITLYGTPISSSATLILRPFGVFQVCSSMVILLSPRNRCRSVASSAQAANTSSFPDALHRARGTFAALLMARDRLWNVGAAADRLRRPQPRETSLVQVSFPRPSRRDHPQAFVRTRRDHAG